MKAVLVGLIVIVVVVVAILAGVDIARTPTPAAGTCVLVDRLILPDICASGCAGCAECPTGRTRPYLFFWTEAAACPDACICGASGRNPLELGCVPRPAPKTASAPPRSG